MKILLVEDDDVIADSLAYSLRLEDYEVDIMKTVKDALAYVGANTFDICLLDLTLPDGNGFSVCDAIKNKTQAAVIFLTACDDEVNVVRGLDMGADDYVTKPFRIRELISRIKSVVRRNANVVESSVIQIKDIKINTKEAKAYKNSEEVILTALEYRLLLTFANNKGIVLSRDKLLEGIWDMSGDFVNDNTLTVYIKRLRQKLGDDSANPSIIKTVRGLGYILGE